MRWLLIIAAARRDARRVLENPRVRAYRTHRRLVSTAWLTAPASSSRIADAPGMKAGSAVWVEDAAVRASHGRLARLDRHRPAASPGRRVDSPPPAGSKPGEAPFTGMSFKPIFENDRVSVIRARMEVGAREGFHTHGSDTIVVHLSGGEIEDTADGKTVVNRWKPGDVEFEALGSSHSARNVGGAVDVVLVALKPQ